MKYEPQKVFILENGRYVEISYEELCRRTTQDKYYEDKLFLPLHRMLMEVQEDEYRTFYKNVRRQKYLKELSTANGDFSYDMLDKMKKLENFDKEAYRELIKQMVVYKDYTIKVIFKNGSSIKIGYGNSDIRKGESDGSKDSKESIDDSCKSQI